MVCAAAAKGTKEHAEHHCTLCVHRYIAYTESPCKECSELPGKCEWKTKED